MKVQQVERDVGQSENNRKDNKKSNSIEIWFLLRRFNGIIFRHIISQLLKLDVIGFVILSVC